MTGCTQTKVGVVVAKLIGWPSNEEERGEPFAVMQQIAHVAGSAFPAKDSGRVYVTRTKKVQQLASQVAFAFNE